MDSAVVLVSIRRGGLGELGSTQHNRTKPCSTQWGTRDVSSFDSGVTKSRKVAMRRRRLLLLALVMGVSAGVGVLVSILVGVVG